MEKLDLAFEIENYFSKNNFRNVDLAQLNIPNIYDHAEKLDRELTNYKREVKFEGKVQDIFEEMVSWISFSLGRFQYYND